MPPIKRILVPTDFSAPADNALRYAAGLALVERPQLTVLHVFQFPAYFFPDGSVVTSSPDLVTELTTRIDGSLTLARRMAEAAGACDVQTLQVQGIPVSEIVREADAFDLIVMGTHGHTGLSHVLLGSVAERVVRKAPCPVLTVRMNKP
jgi:nucleotide-binding universal stress UspA family protein